MIIYDKNKIRFYESEKWQNFYDFEEVSQGNIADNTPRNCKCVAEFWQFYITLTIQKSCLIMLSKVS